MVTGDKKQSEHEHGSETPRMQGPGCSENRSSSVGDCRSGSGSRDSAMRITRSGGGRTWRTGFAVLRHARGGYCGAL